VKQHSRIERSFNVSEMFTSDLGKLSLVLLKFSLSYTCVYGRVWVSIFGPVKI